MAATFEVVLDTHAPVLNASLGQWDPVERKLSIPFTADEPALVTGYYQPFVGPGFTYPVFAVDGEFVATLPDGVDGGNGRAFVTLTDDVLNSALYTLTIGREPIFAPPVRVRTLEAGGYYGDPEPILRMTGVSPALSDPPTIQRPRKR